MQLPASLSAAEAAQLLGVKPQTLYAYASRGLVRRVGVGKRRRYLREDLERLQARQRARAGHGAVAAGALSFGEPVLDSRITELDAQGPHYRGLSAIALASAGASFEAVAELLWSGAMPETPPSWRSGLAPGASLGPRCTSLQQLLWALPTFSAQAAEHLPASEAQELALGRHLVRGLALVQLPPGARKRSGSIAELLASQCQAPRGSAVAALDLALVLLADHELNASSFAARVAASTDANLPACLCAALATLSGPRHGGACDRVEALLDEAAALARPADVIERRARRGDALPGFGHPLYPHGDPRAQPLLERARSLARPGTALHQQLAAAFTLAKVLHRQGLPANVDFGLVVLTRALRMPPGSAALLFALGRSAGWVAHVREQRASEAILRPRARYLGA